MTEQITTTHEHQDACGVLTHIIKTNLDESAIRSYYSSLYPDKDIAVLFYFNTLNVYEIGIMPKEEGVYA
jgi:hypothetical protein